MKIFIYLSIFFNLLFANDTNSDINQRKTLIKIQDLNIKTTQTYISCLQNLQYKIETCNNFYSSEIIKNSFIGQGYSEEQIKKILGQK